MSDINQLLYVFDMLIESKRTGDAQPQYPIHVGRFS